MKKIDKASVVLNFVLGVIYIPVSIFSYLATMASELTIGATNTMYLDLIGVFCAICFVIPILCIIGIVVSIILRKKGYSKMSIVVQFIPLVVFALNLVYLELIQFLPRVA